MVRVIILRSIFVFAVMYLAGAFLALDIDFRAWSTDGRFAFIIIAFGSSLIANLNILLEEV